MQTDAMNAGVNPGGLKSRVEIRVLICYLLSNSERAVPLEKVKEQLHFGGIANYFEIALAITELNENGTIESFEEDGEMLFKANAESRRVSDALGSGLPYSVKEKALAITKTIVTRRNNERNNEIEIKETDFGFYITCSVLEKDHTLASVSLLVPDKETALSIKSKFIENPMETLIRATEVLTDNKI